MEESKRPVDIPFELVPESQAEVLRHRLAVAKRAERLAMRDRMRRRKKSRVSLDGVTRERRVGGVGGGGGGVCGECGGLLQACPALVQQQCSPLTAFTTHGVLLPCSLSDSDSDADAEALDMALTAACSPSNSGGGFAADGAMVG